MRPASKLLLIEAGVLPGLLERVGADELDRPTLCERWSVRDVVAHCGEALSSFASGAVRTFTAEENQAEVDRRSTWPFDRVLDELTGGYGPAAEMIDRLDGLADGIALGEWIHGGDIRHALQQEDAFASAGIELALPLISARSVAKAAPRLHVLVDGVETPFGGGEQRGQLTTDAASFVRLIGGRTPDPTTYELFGVHPEQLILFS
ncbi:MAG: hypothetical protein QOC92_3761 [Acidimicrobiaceae bacterium]|jgi:uncharacterized protein (TIGR03083 family)